MQAETQHEGDDAHRDHAATRPPADKPPESPGEHHGEPDESGGPYGNPEVDEESLRKQQEETSERSDDALG